MNSWAIEVRDKSGILFFGRQVFAISSVVKTVAEVMTFDKTGGIVIYRSTVADSNECETDEEENLEKVASGNGCKTCGCPPEAMPMINRGTGWCCEAHRKEQL